MNGTKEKDLTLAVARRAKAVDRGASRHPRAADARRRPQRADRQTAPQRPTTTRPICSSACTRTRRSRRGTSGASILLRGVRRGRRRSRRRPTAPSACRPSAAARATSSSSRGISRRSRHVEQSVAFADILEQQLHDHMPLVGHPVDRAPLRVLESANMPAVLVEMGYLTNAEQAKRSALDGFRTRSCRRCSTRSSGSATRWPGRGAAMTGGPPARDWRRRRWLPSRSPGVAVRRPATLGRSAHRAAGTRRRPRPRPRRARPPGRKIKARLFYVARTARG